ncbi:MAG TPA: aspartate aminotransferase [Flavobacteriales bacterium]|nr:aspartate aminotransferase [Flavobacteriales bacterium]|tara:strand:- start:111352 stop:112566 length:1215 start_codon:yes stop_codon:yes gene_type:complete
MSTKTYVSDLLNSLPESATLAMARMSRELKEDGKDVISLSLGEPDFNAPDFVKEACKQAVDDDYSHYPPVNGYGELREAICHKFKRDNDLEYTPDQIVVSTGAKQTISNVVYALVNPGDEVLLPAPFWVSYAAMVQLAGGVPVIIPTQIENDFKITAEELKANISDKTRLMIYSSPCNPSGSVYSKEELTALAEVIKSKPDFFVVSDEIYEHINYTGEHASLGTIPGIFDQVVTVNGVSKAFAMTGYRIGYLGAPTWIAKACSKMQGQVTSAPTGVSQMAAKAAVLADPSSVSYMKDAFLKRRDMMLDKLGEIPGLKLNVPEGAFYIFPNCMELLGTVTNDGQEINTSSDLCMYLLQAENVALVAGDAFGAAECFRLSYAASEEMLLEAAVRMKRAFGKLKKQN